MTHPDPTLRDDAIAFVRLGYGDHNERDFRSLEFLTDDLDTDTAKAVVALVRSYNAFQGEKVAAALERFCGRVSRYRFGRSRSPLLHVDLPYWTGQREGQPPGERGERIDAAAHLAIVEELRRVFVNELGADSFGADQISERTLHVWWN